jgi:hypothetical protein
MTFIFTTCMLDSGVGDVASNTMHVNRGSKPRALGRVARRAMLER